MTEQDDLPVALRVLLALAWTATLAFLVNLLLLAAGLMTGDLFSEYLGHFSFPFYLGILSYGFWGRGSQGERSVFIRLVRGMLWLAFVMGAADLVRFGWSFTEVGSLRAASPWRFLSYWAMPSIFLVLLGRPAVSTWVSSGREGPPPNGAAAERRNQEEPNHN